MHQNERQILRETLYQKFLEVYERRLEYPVELEVKRKNESTVTVRRQGHTESGIDMFILERTDLGVLPHQFMALLQHQENFIKCNKRCRNFEILAVEEEPYLESQSASGGSGIEVFVTLIKSPTILVSDRLFIDAKYLWDKECVSILSG